MTQSSLVTSKKYSMVSKMAFDVYACNHDLNTIEVCKKLDPETYYGMNILDYLTGNTDRHPENWGFLIDNDTNRYISLYPVMDFNQCFLAYDDLDGANCQTVLPERMTQREAAIEAVRNIGLRQVREMDMSIFGSRKKEADMFLRRASGNPGLFTIFAVSCYDSVSVQKAEVAKKTRWSRVRRGRKRS